MSPQPCEQGVSAQGAAQPEFEVGAKPPHGKVTTDFERYSIAGKVFVLGEYAVLSSLPAVVATVGPRFEMTVARNGSAGVTGANPSVGTVAQGSDSALGTGVVASSASGGSPLARLKNWARGVGLADLEFQFHDPHHGAGGFGASTAEFAMAYLAYSKEDNFPGPFERGMKWNSTWKLYRELTGNQNSNSSKNINGSSEGETEKNSEENIAHGAPSPSGVDLIAQWQGGVVFCDPSDQHCLDVWPLFDWSRLLVFSATNVAGRKVPTHMHLAELGAASLQNLANSLEKPLIDGISAIRENDGRRLGEAMDAYAEVLCAAGLEAPASTEDRKTLRELPGVVGVKGAGAMLADAVLVLLHPQAQREHIIQVATERGLKLIADGLTCQMGVLCQKW